MSTQKKQKPERHHLPDDIVTPIAESRYLLGMHDTWGRAARFVMGIATTFFADGKDDAAKTARKISQRLAANTEESEIEWRKSLKSEDEAIRAMEGLEYEIEQLRKFWNKRHEFQKETNDGEKP